MQELNIGANEAGQRFDKYLKKLFPEAPSGLLYGQLRKKNITLNRKKAEGKELLKEGDLVQCFFSQETFDKFLGLTEKAKEASVYQKAYQKLHGIQVLYEDSNFLFSSDKSINETKYPFRVVEIGRENDGINL